MALPLIPILAVAAIAMFAGAKPKRRKKPIVVPPTPDDEGELYAFGLADFMEGEPLEIDVFPQDMIRFDFEAPVGPAQWQMYSEVTEGAPVLVVEEDHVIPGIDAPEGQPGRYITDILVQPGIGTVQMDFMLVETGIENPQVLMAKQAIIRVV